MSKGLSHFLAFLASVLWGINFISMKYLSDYFPSYSLVFLRFVIAALFLWLMLWYRRKKDPTLKPLAKKDYKDTLITGFFGIALYFYFYTFGLKYLTANMAALLCALIPIFSLLGEIVVFKKRYPPIVYAFSLLSIFGVFLVLDMKLSELVSSDAFIGILLMSGTNLSWVVYTMITGNLQKTYGSLSSLTFQSTAGCIVLGLTALSDIKSALVILTTAPNAGLIILNLIYVGVGSSALAYLFYIEGMKHIGLQMASLYMNVIPIVAAV
ncbi:MAG: DMT family transporter, partial [Clostridia bacterium]|nr:DMT family transporter [Clostridia bacterium]